MGGSRFQNNEQSDQKSAPAIVRCQETVSCASRGTTSATGVNIWGIHNGLSATGFVRPASRFVLSTPTFALSTPTSALSTVMFVRSTGPL